MNFDQIFDRLMGNEGGYVNNPKDPGGETNWGICKRSYPDVDIKNLTKEGAKDIYWRDFWTRGQMDKMDPVVAFQVFDFAVNSGVETAIRKLQQCVDVADDGIIGPVTLAAIKKYHPAQIVMLFVGARLDFWRRLSTWPVFGSGWAHRAAVDLRYGALDINP